MPTDHRSALASIRRFDQLIAYLRDEMGWPIARDSFEDVDDLFYDFTADELGIDPKTAAKIESIKRLRPLSPRQPWGIFFVKFEPKKLPVVALRRILSQVALKKRASANSAERTAWAKDDLLFVSNYGEGDERQISFAHFSTPGDGHDLPTLKVLGWDNRDTALHLDEVARELTEHLAWPEDDSDTDAWRKQWRAAFTLGHHEVVATSKELAIRLAVLARAIRDRTATALAIETDRGPLRKLMKAFQEVLVHDLDADGFADMYAQTIAYGLLSARIADPHRKTVDDFAAHMRTNPFLRELMETFIKVGGRRGKAGDAGIDFDELGVSEVVDLLDNSNMEAVVRDFGDRNPLEDPVIHFYELFLKEYDAKKRMQRGVFYTPRPVVSYIVRSVDELLRTEFGLGDGLADTATWGEVAERRKDLKIPDGVSPDQDFVKILDPATGTGTFLVEAIDLIYKTLVAKWRAEGHSETKIDAMWNEYVPKHLLPRLHGYELLMAPYAIAHLKIGLKLYETRYPFDSSERARVYLTNALEPPHDFSGSFEFVIPALAHEAQAVNEIKRQKGFTVVFGNPPYAGHSANNGPWIDALVNDYFHVDGTPLNEANSKWLRDDYVKFLRFGQELMHRAGVGVFSFITNHGYIDNPTFRGMRFSLLAELPRIWITDLHGNMKKKERDDAGDNDDNVFDIQQGVAVFAGLKSPTAGPAIWHGHLRGDRSLKYTRLSKETASRLASVRVYPAPPLYLFVPQDVSARDQYERFLSLAAEVHESSLGILTKRDSLAIAFSPHELLEALRRFADSRRSDAEVAHEFGVPLADKDKWQVSAARASLVRVDEQKVRPLLYRPFDVRFVYYDDTLVARTNRRVFRHLEQVPGNRAFILGRQGMSTGAATWDVCFVCDGLADQNIYRRGGGTVLPLQLADHEQGLGLGGYELNFSKKLIDDFAGFCVRSEDWFEYAYTLLYSPGYRSRYAEFLKFEFPRLPLPKNVELFRALAPLGGELVALHLLKSPELDKITTELISGRHHEVEKVSWSKDSVWVDKAQTTGFSGVPEEVWNFHIGGYQVCEKWLKDRRGRILSNDDIAHYQKIVVALSETIRLMKEIDEVIEQHGDWPGAFQT